MKIHNSNVNVECFCTQNTCMCNTQPPSLNHSLCTYKFISSQLQFCFNISLHGPGHHGSRTQSFFWYYNCLSVTLKLLCKCITILYIASILPYNKIVFRWKTSLVFGLSLIVKHFNGNKKIIFIPFFFISNLQNVYPCILVFL